MVNLVWVRAVIYFFPLLLCHYIHDYNNHHLFLHWVFSSWQELWIKLSGNFGSLLEVFKEAQGSGTYQLRTSAIQSHDMSSKPRESCNGLVSLFLLPALNFLAILYMQIAERKPRDHADKNVSTQKRNEWVKWPPPWLLSLRCAHPVLSNFRIPDSSHYF